MKFKLLKYMVVLIMSASIPPIKSFLSLMLVEKHYRYSNGDGTWNLIEIPFKGRVFNFTKTLDTAWLWKDCPQSDTTVYRLYKKDFWAFWRFGEYLYDKRYILPYKSRDEIRRYRTVHKITYACHTDFKN